MCSGLLLVLWITGYPIAQAQAPYSVRKNNCVCVFPASPLQLLAYFPSWNHELQPSPVAWCEEERGFLSHLGLCDPVWGMCSWHVKWLELNGPLFLDQWRSSKLVILNILWDLLEVKLLPKMYPAKKLEITFFVLNKKKSGTQVLRVAGSKLPVQLRFRLLMHNALWDMFHYVPTHGFFSN